MKPLVLTMQAFGPYRGKTTLDFKELGNQLLFLIYGATGSGKTTILDAIVYALFGETSGGLRSGETLRSDLADPRVETFVEFEFALGQEEYRIRRAPKQELLKKRGEGSRIVEATAILYEKKEGEWQSLTAKKAVLATKVKELFGFAAKQFLQVILLPQGEFRKLLIASTSEREKILKELFKTERYEALQLALKEKAKGLQAQIAEREKEKFRLLQEAEVDGLDSWDLKIQQLKKYLEEAVEASETLKKEQDILGKEILSLLDSKEKTVERIKILESELKELSQKRLSQQLEWEPLRIWKEQEGERANEQVARKLALSQLEQEIKEIQTWEEQVKNKKALQALQVTRKECIREEEKALHSIQDRVKIVEEQHKLLLDNLSKEDGLSLRRQELVAIRGQYIKWNGLEKELEELAHEVERLAMIENEKYERMIAKEIAAEALFSSYQVGQAYAMGKSLVDGVACPVCGSVHHPKKAEVPEFYVSEEEWKQGEKEKEEAKNAWRDAEKDRSVKASYVEKRQLEYAQERRTTTLLSEEEVDEAFRALEEREKAKRLLEEDITTIEEERERLVAEEWKIKNNIHSMQEEVANADGQLVIVCEAIQKSEQLFEGGIPEVVVLQRKKETLKESIVSQEQDIQRQEIAYRELLKEKESLEETYSKQKGALEALKESIVQTEATLFSLQQTHEEFLTSLDIFTLERELVSLRLHEKEMAYQESVRKVGQQSTQLEGEERRFLSYSALMKQSDQESSMSEMIFKLSDLANGGAHGFSGLTFERYVLGAVLEEVVAAANIRLTHLTRGRFLLERTAIEAKGNRHQGLDLSIFDSETGASRPAITLSGGETFLASLALSLGLADVVQSYAGGIHLDTIFVDEGFGTLDTETLDVALEALSSLQESGRLVGIISHVSELQRRIPARLEVVKTSAGSSAKFAPV